MHARAEESPADAAAVMAQLRALLLTDQQPPTWQPAVGPSTVGESSGDGVHLRGSCEAGTVLLVYPGVSYQPEDLPVMHQLILSGNSYVLARRDGVLVDARPSGASLQIYDMARQRDAAARRGGVAPCDTVYATGHKVNHPSAGLQPNVVVAPVDVHEADADLAERVPTFPFRPPAKGQPLKQTAVLIAARRLCDEELLLDYKLRPEGSAGWEPWYVPVSESEGGREGAGCGERG